MFGNFFDSIKFKWKRNKAKRRYQKWDASIEDTVISVLTLLKSHDSDPDKSEVFNRVRIRFESYIDQKTVTKENDLLALEREIKELKKEQSRIKAPVVYEVVKTVVAIEESKSSITSTEEIEEVKLLTPNLAMS